MATRLKSSTTAGLILGLILIAAMAILIGELDGAISSWFSSQGFGKNPLEYPLVAVVLGLIVNGILRLIGQHRPLLFFGGSGLIVLLVGMAWGAWVVSIYRRAQILAVGYAMIAVLLCIVGSVSLSTGIILHSLRGLLLELLDRKV